MRVFELLGEAFNTNALYKPKEVSADTFETEAEIGGRTIRFAASKITNNGKWEVEFYERNKHGGTTFGASGSGSATKVFSMVLSSLKEFIEVYAPTSFELTAEGDSRASLYRKIATRHCPEGYSYTELSIAQHQAGKVNAVRFVFKRKEPASQIDEALKYGAKGETSIPILNNGEVIGGITFARYDKHQRSTSGKGYEASLRYAGARFNDSDMILKDLKLRIQRWVDSLTDKPTS